MHVERRPRDDENDDTIISPAPGPVTPPPALLARLIKRPGPTANRPPRIVRTVSGPDGIARVVASAEEAQPANDAPTRITPPASHPADDAPTRVGAPAFSDVVSVVEEPPPSSSFDPPTRLAPRPSKHEMPTIPAATPAFATLKNDIATIPAAATRLAPPRPFKHPIAPLLPGNERVARAPSSVDYPMLRHAVNGNAALKHEIATLPSGEFSAVAGTSDTFLVATDPCGIIRAGARAKAGAESASAPSDQYRVGRYECISETVAAADTKPRRPREYPSHTRILVPAGTRSLMRPKSRPRSAPIVPYRIEPVFPVLAPMKRRHSSFHLAALGLVSAFWLGHTLYELARATFLVAAQTF